MAGAVGLGLVLAREFASRGARLVLLARDEAELGRARRDLEARGAEAVALRCDVSRRGEVESAIARAHERFGTIDVLVNNAGVIQVGPLNHMTEEDSREAMGAHFWGPLYVMLASSPSCAARASAASSTSPR